MNIALKRTIVKYSVFISYIIFLLLISELILRAFRPIDFSLIDPLLPSIFKLSDNGKIAYELRPNTEDINSAGFRDFEYKIDKDPGTTRIVVIGDSIAYGIGIEDSGFEKTYAKQLETFLNKQNKKRFEVLNFGVPGYDTVQIFEHFKDKAMKYMPDIVIYGYWFNDFNHNCTDLHVIDISSDSISVKNWKIYSSFIAKHFLLKKMAIFIVESELFKRSYVYYCELRRHFFAKKDKNSFLSDTVLSDGNGARYWYGVFNECVEKLRQKNDISFLDEELNRQDFYEYWNAFRDLAGYCKEHSVRLILLLTPVLSDFSDYKYLPLHECMHKLAGSIGIEVVDTLDSFREKYKVTESIGTCHFNESGHFIVAEAIEEYLERNPAY